LRLQDESVSVDVEAKLRVILKSYDRIGFGRRGVLDAEQEIRRWATGLSDDDQARFCQIVLAWIDPTTAQLVSSPLHYNLPEHVQALAIRLCATFPIPESLRLLRRLQVEDAFKAAEEKVCRDALAESLTILADHLGRNPTSE
jgi:hypothetical protein